MNQTGVCWPMVVNSDEKNADDDGVGNEYAAIAERGQQAANHRLDAHGAKCLRHDQQSGLNRAEAEAGLVEQRKQKRHAADSETREIAAVHGCAEGANAEKPEAKQRKLERSRMQPVADEK